MDPYTAVFEFHKAFNLPVAVVPAFPDEECRELRRKLLKEEYDEYIEGETFNDMVEVADALADMTYIIYGTAVAYGIPLNKVFAVVHESNMAKLGPDGNPIYRPDGKVIKPLGWLAPNIAQVLLDNGWNSNEDN